MTTITETVYIGHDNAIRLMLLEDNIPFTDRYPTVTPVQWVLTLGSVVIDSDDYPTAFAWDAENSTLELNIGPVVTQECALTEAELVLYAAPWPNGIVWTHPVTTVDHLAIKILN